MAHNQWWLPREEWYAMTPEKQRLHKIKVRAYFLNEQRQKDGTAGTPESDWAAAEWETNRAEEADMLYSKSRNCSDMGEQIRFSVLYHICNILVMRSGDINDQTPLPTDKETRVRLSYYIGWRVSNSVYRIPDDITTVGSLIEAVKKTTIRDNVQALRDLLIRRGDYY
jgi:hypothetical protein